MKFKRHILRFTAFWIFIIANSLFVSNVFAQCPPGMVCYWTFDDGTGIDFLGMNDGNILGAVPIDGKIGGALLFDGIDDQVLAASKSLDQLGLYQNGRPDVTMVTWFKLQQPGWFDQSPLVAIGSTDYWPHRRYVLSVQYWANPTPRLCFWGAPELIGTTPLEKDQWYQGALVIKNSEPGRIVLFLNGNKEFEYEGAPTYPITNENIKIGYMVGWYPNFHNGIIDEVAIYNRALSEEEIFDLYQKSSVGIGYCNYMDTIPPVITHPTDMFVEATGPDGAVANYTASALDAVDGPVPVSYSIAPGSFFPFGSTTVTVTAVDFAGNTATATFTVTVRDTTAPDISMLKPSKAVLWPPNHKMVSITMTAIVSDNSDPFPGTRIVSVKSNEPANGTGDGDTSPDWEITGDLTLKLRAERDGKGLGRIYTITIESVDNAGNNIFKDASVSVPRSMGGGA